VTALLHVHFKQQTKQTVKMNEFTKYGNSGVISSLEVKTFAKVLTVLLAVIDLSAEYRQVTPVIWRITAAEVVSVSNIVQ